MYHVTLSVYLEFVCPLFSFFNPTKEGLAKSKQGSFGLQTCLYYKFIYIPAGMANECGLLEGPHLIVPEGGQVSSSFGNWARTQP